MKEECKPTFRDAQQAFKDAIYNGHLSTNKRAHNYAGKYMYMHTMGTVDYFKHVETRRYIEVDYAA